jgi:hypothetical protein
LGEWSAKHAGCFTPRDKAPVTHSIEGWVGSIGGLDILEYRVLNQVFLTNTQHY